MAPRLATVYNVSGNSVHVDIGVKSFDIENDKSQPINCSLTTDGYTKILIANVEEDQAYLLKYVHPNIKLNDPRGKHNGVADCAVRMEYSNRDIRISILKGEMHISCDGPFLGIYQPDGNPKYYSSIVARHIPEGGIKVLGGVNVEGDGDVKEDEVEEASASTKGPDT